MSSKNLPVIAKPRPQLEPLSPLQLYLQEISKYPLLSPDEEYQLAVEHFEKGDVKAAHRLVTSNLRLVLKIANDFRQTRTSIMDLVQEGNYGLMQAVKRFNPYKGVKLSSYAAWWIRAYILKFIMDNKSQVKIGTTVAQRKLFFRLKKETEKLLAEYETADPKLLAERLDVSEQEVLEMQQRLSGPDLSMEDPVGEEGITTRGSLMSSDEPYIDDVVAENEIRRTFEAYLKDFEKSLSGRDLEIFRDRLISENPLTLQEIGDRYQITRERARQLESRIIQKLKDYVKDQGVIEVSQT